MRWALFIVICALMSGCAPKIEIEKDEKPIEQPVKQIVSRENAVRSLPCFECHSYDKFAAGPEKGMFSHQLHDNIGYHCNQCHGVRGHKPVAFNWAACTTCHNLKEMTLNRTALPAKFNHEKHAAILSCKECHPNLFLMSRGATHVTMKDKFEGRFCGACHDGRRAFPSSECAKCHQM